MTFICHKYCFLTNTIDNIIDYLHISIIKQPLRLLQHEFISCDIYFFYLFFVHIARCEFIFFLGYSH